MTVSTTARGVAFSTYATWWIRHAVREGLIRLGRTVRLPQHVERRVARVRSAEAGLSRNTGRTPSARELGAALGLGRDEVEDLRRWDAATVSLDGPVGPVAMARAEAGAATGFDPEAQMIDGERRAVLAHAVAGLAPRERDIVRQHFGLAGRPERSLTEIGVGLGMSRERVRQIERGALDRLAERPELRLVHDAA